jgi:hypothetical protein
MKKMFPPQSTDQESLCLPTHLKSDSFLEIRRKNMFLGLMIIMKFDKFEF